MPLGNLTSQFFANVYLNELDYFVKHQLKASYYIRYVDDFVIFHNSKSNLFELRFEIETFLKNKLGLELHPQKSKICSLNDGITFLGFRIFQHHRLLARKNLRKFVRKFDNLKELWRKNEISEEKLIQIIEGWLAYAKNANAYHYRRKLVANFRKEFFL